MTGLILPKLFYVNQCKEKIIESQLIINFFKVQFLYN